MPTFRSRPGFTLIETSVATAIVAVVALIAIPTYNTIAGGTDDQTVKKTLTVLDVELARLEAATPGVFPEDTEDLVEVSGVQVVQGATASTGPDVVSLRTENGRAFATILSDSGTCWVIEHQYQQPIEWAVDDSPASSGCKASSASVSANSVLGTKTDPSIVAMV